MEEVEEQASLQRIHAVQTDRVGAGADPIPAIGRLEEELIQWAMRAARVGEALQPGRRAAEGASVVLQLGRGGASGAAAVPGLVHTCGSVGRFVWCVLSYHSIT